MFSNTGVAGVRVYVCVCVGGGGHGGRGVKGRGGEI